MDDIYGTGPGWQPRHGLIPESDRPAPDGETFEERQARRDWVSQGGAPAFGLLDVGLPTTVPLQRGGMEPGLPWAPPQMTAEQEKFHQMREALRGPRTDTPQLHHLQLQDPRLTLEDIARLPEHERGRLGAGSSVAPGLRQPFGETPSVRSQTHTERITGFDPAWGAPGSVPGFVWDAARFVMEPVRDSRRDPQEYQDLTRLADEGVYMQPYKPDRDPNGAWDWRWVKIIDSAPGTNVPYEEMGRVSDMPLTSGHLRHQRQAARPQPTAEETAARKASEAQRQWDAYQSNMAAREDLERWQEQERVTQPTPLDAYRWVRSTDLPKTCPYPYPYMPVPRADYESGWYLHEDYVPSIPLPWPYNEIPWQCRLEQGATGERGKGGGGPKDPDVPVSPNPDVPISELSKVPGSQGATIGPTALALTQQKDPEDDEEGDSWPPEVENDPNVKREKRKLDRDKKAAKRAADEAARAAKRKDKKAAQRAQARLKKANETVERRKVSLDKARARVAERAQRQRGQALESELRKLKYKERTTWDQGRKDAITNEAVDVRVALDRALESAGALREYQSQLDEYLARRYSGDGREEASGDVLAFIRRSTGVGDEERGRAIASLRGLTDDELEAHLQEWRKIGSSSASTRSEAELAIVAVAAIENELRRRGMSEYGESGRGVALALPVLPRVPTYSPSIPAESGSLPGPGVVFSPRGGAGPVPPAAPEGPSDQVKQAEFERILEGLIGDVADRIARIRAISPRTRKEEELLVLLVQRHAELEKILRTQVSARRQTQDTLRSERERNLKDADLRYKIRTAILRANALARAYDSIADVASATADYRVKRGERGAARGDRAEAGRHRKKAEDLRNSADKYESSLAKTTTDRDYVLNGRWGFRPRAPGAAAGGSAPSEQDEIVIKRRGLRDEDYSRARERIMGLLEEYGSARRALEAATGDLARFKRAREQEAVERQNRGETLGVDEIEAEVAARAALDARVNEARETVRNAAGALDAELLDRPNGSPYFSIGESYDPSKSAESQWPAKVPPYGIGESNDDRFVFEFIPLMGGVVSPNPSDRSVSWDSKVDRDARRHDDGTPKWRRGGVQHNDPSGARPTIGVLVGYKIGDNGEIGDLNSGHPSFIALADGSHEKFLDKASEKVLTYDIDPVELSASPLLEVGNQDNQIHPELVLRMRDVVLGDALRTEGTTFDRSMDWVIRRGSVDVSEFARPGAVLMGSETKVAYDDLFPSMGAFTGPGEVPGANDRGKKAPVYARGGTSQERPSRHSWKGSLFRGRR